ncbi:hypothetical protein UlMin_034224 [Ulmus minor]
MVGEHVAKQYVGGEKGPTPKGIQTIVRTNLNTKVSYYKALRGRWHAQSLIRGSSEESFYMLPSYCYMIEMENPGTVTRIEVDGECRFKYFFLAFGASIRGFNYMRKVIGIDGTFLKGSYNGVLLVATTQDGNSKYYPIAWGIVDSKNNDSWTWFLTRLKEVIGDINELVFVSDMAKSIKNFKCSDIMGSYWKAVNAYMVVKFNGYMTKISRRYPRVSKYHENEVGFEKWSRCHFPSLRYNIMTTNMVESLNSMLVNAREFPYIALVDVIQAKMSKW